MTRVVLSSLRHRATAYVEAEVEVSLKDISSEDLVLEIQDRGDYEAKIPKELEAFPEGTMREVLDLVMANRSDEAELFIRQILWPRWKRKEDCEAAFKTLINNHKLTIKGK